ncbi:hypothetical protein SVAN01_03644 [Stagonosporopsis vannaccii]|nr:hypothetical protein SVAN01_03644 [Stagonosporopsis vannaccii]
MSDQGRVYRAIAPLAAAPPQLPPPNAASEPQASALEDSQWLSALHNTPMTSTQLGIDGQFTFDSSMNVFDELPALDTQAGDSSMAGQAVAGQNLFAQQDFAMAVGDRSGALQQNPTTTGVEHVLPHPDFAMAGPSINALYFPPVVNPWQMPLATPLSTSASPQKEQVQVTDEHELCKVCNEFYFKARNHEISFNLPTPDPMDPLWVTWDEDVNGPMETSRNRQAFKRAFRWPCCGRPSPAGGCTSNFHVAWEKPGEGLVQWPSQVEVPKGTVGLGVVTDVVGYEGG